MNIFIFVLIKLFEFVKIFSSSHFLDKTTKLWKVSERDKRVADGNWNLRDDSTGGYITSSSNRTTTTTTSPCSDPASLKFPNLVPMELVVEASPRRLYANAHTYHINSISVNSDQENFLSADDLRINLWHFEITNQSFSKRLRFLVWRYRMGVFYLDTNVFRYSRY